MKIAICDDNAQDLALIKEIIAEIKIQLEIEFDDVYFQSGEEIIAYAGKTPDFSLVILDIYMKAIDGINTARRLCELVPGLQTAFLTTSRDFAVDAFKLNAVHYIVKPVTKEKMTELMERFFERTHSVLKKIVLNSRHKTYTFALRHVQKIRSGNKGVDVYLLNAENPVHIYESFANIEEQLDGRDFLKISRGLIVNMAHILCIDSDTCRFRDGTSALISRMEKSNILHKYNDYLFNTDFT